MLKWDSSLPADFLYNFWAAFVDTAFSVAVFVFSLIGLSQSIFVRIAEPSFDLRRWRRWNELLFGYGLLAALLILFGSILNGILNVPKLEEMGMFKYFIPAIIYIYFRSIARFISSRVSKDLLMSFCFVYLLVVSLRIGFAFYDGHSFLALFFINKLDPVDYIAYTLVGLIAVFGGDVILYHLPLKFKSTYKAKARLIDLTDKLPVEMEKVFWEVNINKRIVSLIESATEEIVILSKHFRTLRIPRLLSILEEKKKSGVLIKLIACDKELCILKDKDLEFHESLMSDLAAADLHYCSGTFDNVRVIIVDRKAVLTSFATAGYDNSHVGIYITHPFAVALFNNYIDTKCHAMGCKDDCR